MKTPLRDVKDREYVETLSCGHKISWGRPAPGTGGVDWPKLVMRRRCPTCAHAHPDPQVFVVTP